MKQFTKKQKIIAGVVIVLLLAAAFLYNAEFLRNRETADAAKVEELRVKENEDLRTLTQPKTPKEEEKVPEEPPVEITKFYIAPDKSEAKPGDTVKFQGYFEGTGDFKRDVTWTLQGTHHGETVLSPEGILTISPKETVKEIFVKGTSVEDSTKVGVLGVKVDQPKEAEKPKPETSKPATAAKTASGPKTATPAKSPGKPEESPKAPPEKKAPVKAKNTEELEAIAKEQQAEISEEEKAKREAEAKKIKEQAIAATSGNLTEKYHTAPTPEGKPKPVEPQDAVRTDTPETCTLSIRCDTILQNMDLFDMDKIDVLPPDGTILPTTEVTFYEGESVYDMLLREMKNRGIHMESTFTPMYNSAYVEGIHNLYEFDCGELSGWMYKVNGWFPNYGVSRYLLKPGDVVEFVYTCDLGRDVGDTTMTQ